jgi:hypothetical protein
MGGGGPDFGFIGDAVSTGLDVTEQGAQGLKNRATWLSGELRAGSSYAGRELPGAGALARDLNGVARLAGRIAGPIELGLTFAHYYTGYSPRQLATTVARTMVYTTVASGVITASLGACTIEVPSGLGAPACVIGVAAGVTGGDALGARAAQAVP